MTKNERRLLLRLAECYGYDMNQGGHSAIAVEFRQLRAEIKAEQAAPAPPKREPMTDAERCELRKGIWREVGSQNDLADMSPGDWMDWAIEATEKHHGIE